MRRVTTQKVSSVIMNMQMFSFSCKTNKTTTLGAVTQIDSELEQTNNHFIVLVVIYLNQSVHCRKTVSNLL